MERKKGLILSDKENVEDYSDDTYTSLSNIVVVLLSLVTFAVIVYYVYQNINNSQDDAHIPILSSSSDPVKIAPLDPGGIVVPNTDKSVYDAIAGVQPHTENEQETLAPFADQPLDPTNLEALLHKANDTNYTNSNNALEPQTNNLGMTNSLNSTNSPSPKVAADGYFDSEGEQMNPDEQALNRFKKKLPKDYYAETPSENKQAQENISPDQGYRIQIASLRSEDSALNEWKKIKAKHPGILEGNKAMIERKDLGGEKGIVYRLQIGVFATEADAKSMCKKLQSQNQPCFVAK